MSYSKYRVYLQNSKGQVEFFEYQLFDSPIVYKWLAITRNCLMHSLPFTGVSVSVRPERETLMHQYQKLLNEVLEIPEIFPNELIVKCEQSDFSQDLLNQLHFCFQSLEEAKAKRPYWSKLQRLNNHIHEIEKAFNDLGSNSDFYEQQLHYYFRGHQKLALDASDFDYFLEKPKFGELVLSYGTTGKSFLQTFHARDHELLLNHRVRPQREVGSGVILKFPSQEYAPNQAEIDRQEAIDWGVQILGEDAREELENPTFSNCENPKLGEITHSYSNADIEMILAEYQSLLRVDLY